MAMVTIDDAHELLDEIAAELPQDFWKELNGGVCLLPDTKVSPEAVKRDLYVLGEYAYSPVTGRCIYIYYGSFHRLFRNVTREEMKTELRRVLFHEFTHHVESLAGERGLEIKDQQQMAEYHRRNKPPQK